MAEFPPLASPQDVKIALGRDLTDSETARVQGILLKASALFRQESGQTFTPARSVVRLKVNAGRLYLPQRPAGVLHSAVDDDGSPVPYRRQAGHNTLGQWLRIDLPSDRFVTVDYEHGGNVPDLVVATIAEIPKTIFGLSEDAIAGVTQSSETAGPFSRTRTYATWTQGGQTRLSPDDVAVARSFRFVAPRQFVGAVSASTEPPRDRTWPLL